MGRIIHGNENFGYAPITLSGNTYVFGTPVMLPGLVSASIEVEENVTNVPADDKIYCRVRGAKVRTATAALRYIPAAYAQYLGYKTNANGMLTDTGEHSSHCIFFETVENDCETNTETRTLHYLYNVQAATPTMESQTDSDSDITAQEISVSYSALESSIALDDDGNKVQYGYITRTEANKDVYDTFKTAVLLPTSAMSV